MAAKPRVAINGFGRIGRNFVRAMLARNAEVDLVAVNDLSEADALVHLLNFDTVHGPLATPSHAVGSTMVIGDAKVALLAERQPAALPWAKLGVDIVIESTGRFTDRAGAAEHLAAGAGRVVVSAPATDADLTVCVGVNEGAFVPAEHRVISNASCTTNCLAPMAKVLQDRFGIRSGYVTTVHAYTNDQNLLDLVHRDPRRGRSAAQNITPSSTGAARAIGLVLPELAGKLDGLALRVPVPDGSVTDLVCALDEAPSVEELNAAFAEAATTMAGVLQYTELPLVSSDIIGNPHSCVFSAIDTMVGPDLVKVLGWYDNEWGYANRLLDLVEYVHARQSGPVSA
jgi:glyceraldehyde 3-phosphate dehydrogenase